MQMKRQTNTFIYQLCNILLYHVFLFRQFSCRKQEHLEDFVIKNIHQFEGTFGVLLFLYSILLSKVFFFEVVIRTGFVCEQIRRAIIDFKYKNELGRHSNGSAVLLQA